MSSNSENTTRESRAARSRAAWAFPLVGGAWLATAVLLLALKPLQAAAFSSALPGALRATLPAVWSATAASSASPTRLNALLWWLQASTTPAAAAAPAAANSASAALSHAQAEELLAIRSGISVHRADATDATLNAQTQQHRHFQPLHAASFAPPHSLQLPARRDITRRILFHALSAHEAAFLAGARANRFLE